MPKTLTTEFKIIMFFNTSKPVHLRTVFCTLPNNKILSRYGKGILYFSGR